MITQLGISVLAPIIICTLAGYYLDRSFGTNLTFILLVLGFLAGARNGYMAAKHLIWLEKREDENEDEN